MVKYLYDRYNFSKSYTDTAPWELISTTGSEGFVSGTSGNLSYTLSTGNTYGLSGGTKILRDLAYGESAYRLGTSETGWGAHRIIKYTGNGAGGGSYYGKDPTKNSSTNTRGALVLSNIIAENGSYPLDGVHTDGYWYVRKAAVSPTAPPSIVIPANAKGGTNLTVTFTKGTDPEGELTGTDWEYSYNGGTSWLSGGSLNAAATSFVLAIPADVTKTKVRFRLRSKDGQGLYSAYATTADITLLQNNAPTVSLLTANNATLYENDTFIINGSAQDTDNGNFVNVRYQINVGTARAIATGISNGTTAISFNKLLTFKGGILYDDTIAITEILAEGAPYTLKVWAEDDQTGKSVVSERTFYVVPNRPPALTIDPFTAQKDLINNDKITFSGTSSDPDGNEVRVSYKLNNGLATQIHAGPGAPWTFDLMLKNLIDGENIIIIEVIDSYNFKTSKTLKFNKTKVITPLLKSTVRYEIISPSGSAKGVLLWIRREKDLTVKAEASMKLVGEQEQYLPMELRVAAPINESIMEDDYIIPSVDPKQKIFIKLDISRPNTTIDPAVTLIMGVLNT